MTPAARHDPYVVLRDDAQIADARARRRDDQAAKDRAADMLTLIDRLTLAATCGEIVTVCTHDAGDVSGRLVRVTARFVMVEETMPVPRVVLIPCGQLVMVAVAAVSPAEIPAARVDDVTTLLTMLETHYRCDAVESTLTNGVTLCAPVVLFGDDTLLLLAGMAGRVLCVAADQIALAAIPPPRRQVRPHTGG